MNGRSADSVAEVSRMEWAAAAARLNETLAEHRRWAGSLDEWLPLYNTLPVVTRSMLLHLHGEHDGAEHPYAMCPLCLAFGPPAPGSPLSEEARR